MGYRDDFYVIGNIIGYTGCLIGNPTVYFRNGNDYGRITQFHGIRTNIGRASVRTHPQYRIGNYYSRGRIVAKEFEGTRCKHTSRNPFIGRQLFRPHDDTLLAAAIRRFQDQKLCDADHVTGRQTFRKLEMQQELKAQFALSRNPMQALNHVAPSPAQDVIMNLAPEPDDPYLRRGGQIG
ncbi:hypothetical protein [Mangrovicoccus ximenensis]|uniref:hypothetical protein n=1 Tax=Mangrovicoccus ximenensis TaxID=1911570 RepID=UPI000D38776F|nr:hypothetical protein [Mangrovicoccus ximenensis]